MRARLSAILGRWKGRLLRRFASPELTLAMRQIRHRVRLQRGDPDISPFPPRNKLVERQVSPANLLVLAPHPDDEAIGLGGLLASHLEAGSRVTVLYLTDGRGPRLSDTSLVEVRRNEARSLGEKYGFEQVFWDVPDTRLRADPEQVGSLAGLLDRLAPNQVFLPSFFDHQYDHFAANELLAGALRQLPGAVPAVLGYEVWDNIPLPNYFFDISDSFERKAEMLSHYRVPNKVTDFIELCRHRAALHYLLYVSSVRRSPEGYAEAFFRTDAVHFVSLLEAYRDLLRKHRSPLVRNGPESGVPPR